MIRYLIRWEKVYAQLSYFLYVIKLSFYLKSYLSNTVFVYSILKACNLLDINQEEFDYIIEDMLSMN